MKKKNISSQIASWFFQDLQKNFFFFSWIYIKVFFFLFEPFQASIKLNLKKHCSLLRLVLCTFKREFSFIVLIFSRLNFLLISTLQLINFSLKGKISFFSFKYLQKIVSFFSCLLIIFFLLKRNSSFFSRVGGLLYFFQKIFFLLRLSN